MKIEGGVDLSILYGRYSSSSRNPVYARHVDSSSLGFSLSSHRRSYIGLVFSVLSINNKQQSSY